MKRKPELKPKPDDYPDSLSGGEPRDTHDHRLGETQRQSPKVGELDPAGTQPDPGAPEQEKDGPPADSGRR